MAHKIKSFETPQDVANAFAGRLIDLLNQSKANGTSAAVCLSGGSTPKLLFKTLAENYADTDWSPLHFFWGDERCVPADSEESNYGEADRLFLNQANIPADNVHAVDTSLDPAAAAAAYQQQIEAVVEKDPAGIPMFDLMVLGMGDDGHTASIFPHQMELLVSEKICDVATHPVSGQKRVTLTGLVISASREICFLITGANKADVLGQILNDQPGSEQYPTGHFSDLPTTTFWVDAATGA